MNVTERFLKYVSIDTESNPDSETTPSTAKQLNLANVLVEEMKEIGIEDAHVDQYGVVYGTIPGDALVETIGFVAHMDTSPDLTGANVNPRIIKNYDGNPIILNEDKQIIMDPKDFPSLHENVGEDLIVTDGTTLLGGDDKAGVAEIMAMAEVLMSQPRSAHGTVKIAFTPDEEVGRGADNFDIKGFNAEYAYTVDGGDIRDVNYENFNAAAAVVKIHGLSIHPGAAKNKMLNSQLIAMEFNALLPAHEDPACTEGYEGFHHLTNINGVCEETTLQYIIRNHNDEIFERQKQQFMDAAAYMNKKYPEGTVECTISHSYTNMRSYIEKDMRVIETVKQAIRDLGMTPVSTPIRGGTDGARLTYDGLPCPNIGTGGYNCHGKFEYVSIPRMETVVELLLKVVENISSRAA